MNTFDDGVQACIRHIEQLAEDLEEFDELKEADFLREIVESLEELKIGD